MREILSLLFFAGGVFFFFWSILCLFRPKMLLWWSAPEKCTRGRAFLFGLLLTLTMLALCAITIPGANILAWILGAGLAGLCVLAGRKLALSQEEQAKKLAEAQKNKQVQVQSQNSDVTYTIWPYRVRCTCPDWEERRAGHLGPFAVCKHLAHHYALHKEDLPESLKIYADLISEFGYNDKGVPPEGAFGIFGHTEDMGYLATGYEDTLPWVNVYTDYGPEQYWFNLESGRWAKDKEPPFAGRISERILKRRSA